MADESRDPQLALAVRLAKAIAAAAPARPSVEDEAGVPRPSPARSDAPQTLGTPVQGISTAPTVFISWAHRHASWDDSQERDWQSEVANFALSLRRLGVDADIDLFHMDDVHVDWTRFGPRGVRDSDHVLIVISKAWAERWEGDNATHEGAGAVAEADELRGLFASDQTGFQRKCSIIQFPGVRATEIPNGLSRLPRYKVNVDNPDSYTDLLRALTGQPRFPKPPLGKMPVLPPVVLGRDVEDRDEALEALRERLIVGNGREPTTDEADSMKRSTLKGLIESLLQEL